MFYGKQRHTMDDKGRIRIPPKMRADLGEKFLIMCGSGGRLLLWSEKEFNERFNKLKDISLADKEGQRIVEIIFSNTELVEEDTQGRIQLSKEQIKHAKIVKNIVTIGANGKGTIRAEEIFDRSELSFEEEDENSLIDQAIALLGKYGV